MGMDPNSDATDNWSTSKVNGEPNFDESFEIIKDNMSFQCIYREDVVTHNGNMIGIVTRVAGDSDSESSITDDGDDNDGIGGSQGSGCQDTKNIDNEFGDTKSKECADDGSMFYDCSDDKSNSLSPDHVLVAWLDGSEAALKSSDVTVTDRRFLHGDYITLASQPTGQMGVVVDVHLSVDLVSSDGFSLKDVSSKDLKRVREFAVGDYVVLGTWLGRVDDVLDNVTVLFEDGSVCKVIKADPSQLKPVGNDANMDVCFPYYPGQHVKTSSSSVFKTSKWLSGSWKAGRLEGIVINVAAASLFIYWLSTSGCGPDSLTTPAEEQSPKNIIKALSCFSHTNWQLGDHCFLPSFNLYSRPSEAELNVSLDNGDDFGQARGDRFADAYTGQKDMFSETVMTDITQGSSESCNIVESNPSNDILSSSKESLLQTWSLHRRKLHKSVLRRDKKMPRKEENYECALLIRNTKKTVDVIWQDGKSECGIEAVGLIPLENPGDHEFLPEQYVMDRGTDENDDDHQVRCTGVVRSVNAVERTANVRWLNPVDPNNGTQEEFAKEEVVSVYELKGHPNYDYSYGDVVVRLSNTAISSDETTHTQKSSVDLNDVKHHINDTEGNESGGRSEFQTSMESFLSLIGNITNLKDGLIEVTWADGVVSMVGPEAVFVVGRDEDESVSGESDTDDADSWETVISNEVAISEITEERPTEVPTSNGVLSIPMSAFGVVAKLASGIFSCVKKDPLPPVGKSRDEYSSNDGGMASETRAFYESDSMPDSINATGSQQNKETVYDNGIETGNVVQRLKAASPVHHAALSSKFKHFDGANNPVDNYFVGISDQVPTGRQWFKKVQQDWSILQNNLPDGIYVRVYEDRMDLLRVAIIGSCGTPYQDGLYFFDFHLPSAYPNVPPSAHYHSGGWRINPNLYEEGKVCLSLLNTWTGRGNEVWDPLSSSILQVLVSLQGLVLNSKPYFNEAGYDKQIGTAEGEKNSVSYSENTFLLNCKTMTYVMRKPPKDFENLVREHFKGRGLYILNACEAYMKGYSIGSLTGEGLAGEGSIGNATSVGFKLMLSKLIPKLVISLGELGVDCHEFEHFVTSASSHGL